MFCILDYSVLVSTFFLFIVLLYVYKIWLNKFDEIYMAFQCFSVKGPNNLYKYMIKMSFKGPNNEFSSMA